jgi:hypothetical protein
MLRIWNQLHTHVLYSTPANFQFSTGEPTSTSTTGKSIGGIIPLTNNIGNHDVKHTKDYMLGYIMACRDSEDQGNFIASGGIKAHTKEFTKGYNVAFSSCNERVFAMYQSLVATNTTGQKQPAYILTAIKNPPCIIGVLYLYT